MFTWFDTVHEQLPVPLRAPTSRLLTPVAVASGIAHYAGSRVPVYESLPLALAANWVGWFLVLGVVRWASRRYRDPACCDRDAAPGGGSGEVRMSHWSAARRGARWMAYLGLACGILYSVGGFVYDFLTTGLNRGTALAFMALVGMPALFAVVGFVLGGLGSVVAAGVSRTRRG